MVRMAIFLRNFCVLYFSASRVQHISDMHSKFALRPHGVCKYGIQSPTAENRRGKKKKEERNTEETTAAKYNGVPYWAAIITLRYM